jgi:hypothetical protein
MDSKMMRRLEKIYKQQALAAMGHGSYGGASVGGAYVGGAMVGGRKPAKKHHAPKHAAHHAMPHMMHPMHGMALMGPLAYSHPSHPYHMMMHGGAYVGGNVHHKHHPGFPGHVGEPHHPNQYAMFVKANYPAVKAALQGKYHGRELSRAVFQEIGHMWRSMGHK